MADRGRCVPTRPFPSKRRCAKTSRSQAPMTGQVSQDDCYLINIPEEIRRMIYKALFHLYCCSDLVSLPEYPDPLVEKLAATKTNKCTEQGHYLPYRGGPVHAEIRATCKFIYDDVSPLFFDHFAMSLSIYDIPVLEGEFWISPSHMAQIRHLVINIPAYCGREIDGDVERRISAVQHWLNFYLDTGSLCYESLKFQQDIYAFRYLDLMPPGYDDLQAADKWDTSTELASMSIIANKIFRQNLDRYGYFWHLENEIRHGRIDDMDEHQYIDRYVIYMSAFRLYNPCPIILPTKEELEEKRHLLALQTPDLTKYMDDDGEFYYLPQPHQRPRYDRLVGRYPRGSSPSFAGRPKALRPSKVPTTRRPEAPRPSKVLTTRRPEAPRPSTVITITVSY